MSAKTSRPPAVSKFLAAWGKWAEEQRLIELASTSQYASRILIVPKRKAGTAKTDPPDGMRVAHDLVRVNRGLKKVMPTYPNPLQAVLKAAKFKYKFQADGLKQYWSIPLHKSTRELTAFWLPGQGADSLPELWQWKRLCMGTKNAATIAQNAYTRALHEKLPKVSQTHS